MFSTYVREIAEPYKHKTVRGLSNATAYIEIVEATLFLPGSAGATQRLWHIWNDTNCVPKCGCGNAVKWDPANTSYRKFCSRKCANTDEQTITKARETNRQRFGANHPMQLPEFQAKAAATNLERYGCEFQGQRAAAREKAQETCRKKYGVDNPNKNADVRKKIQVTNLERYGHTTSLRNPEVQAKARKTTKDRYGVDHASQSPEVQSKVAETFRRKYGVDRPMQDADVQAKARATNKKRHGVEYPGQCEKVKIKARETCQKTYGVDNPFQSDEVKDKIRSTLQDRYGVDHASQSPEIQDKVRETNQERWGGHPSRDVQVREKFRQTCLTVWGVDNPMKSPKVQANLRKKMQELYGGNFAQSHISEKSYKCLEDKEWLLSEHYEKKRPLYVIAQDLGVSSSLVGSYAAQHEITARKKTQSHAETEILEFLKKHYSGKIIQGSRDIIYPKEIDIWIPELNLGIEYCGLYWHSERKRGRHYHRDKMRSCEEKGVCLIQIWENEWRYKRSQVKSRLLSALGIGEKVSARECQVVKVGIRTQKSFLRRFHMQGYIPCKVAYGLKYEGYLISLATFGTPRWLKTVDFEILRSCSAKTVIGGFSKIIKHFTRRHPGKSIVTYCDLRWGQGSTYEKTGFTKVRESSPNSWYFSSECKLHSRIKFQKHRLANLLEEYDERLDVYQNVLNHGWDRIWDCGNAVFMKLARENRYPCGSG